MSGRKVVNAPTSLPAERPSLGTGVEGAYMLIGGGKQVNMDEVLQESSRALKEYQGMTIGARTTFENFEPNISVRDQYTRQQYEYFRPSEALPKRPQDIIRTCRSVYHTVGLIRNIIDLMGDFCCQGIRVTHPNPRINKFYRGWFKKIRGTHTSERFANLFYREGVAIVKRTMGKISVYDEDQLRAIAAARYGAQADLANVMEMMPMQLNNVPEVSDPMEADRERLPGNITARKRVIPLRYNFLNPLTLVAVGGELAQFVGEQYFALKVTGKLRTLVMGPRNTIEKRLVEQIPADLRDAIVNGQAEVALDPRRVHAYSYKKDDWQTWAHPLIYAVMKDLILLEKMKLADLAALDGAITQIRLWKMGDLEKGIMPTANAISRLAEILMSNPGGGAFDLIWGPELSVEEYKTNVHQFLGKAKYEPVLEAIYSGLGIPPTLTGSSNSSGFTNNYISLKTLVQRLEYGRMALREFWETEIALVQQAMGFQRPARVEFDRMVLSDEAAEKALLIQLADRDVISVDTLTERFGEDPDFEEIKLRKEKRQRDSGAMNPKASPYHSPQTLFELVKTALQAGLMTPEQCGIDIPIDFEDQVAPFMTKIKSAEKIAKMRVPPAVPGSPLKGKTGKPAISKPKGSPGRPLNSKDSGQRKQKTIKPLGAKADIDQTAAFLATGMWVEHTAQGEIAEILAPALLQHFGVNTMRSLSNEQAKQAEVIKFGVLCSIDPFTNITPEVVHAILKQGAVIPPACAKLYSNLYHSVASQNSREPTMEELRQIQAYVYVLVNTDEDVFVDIQNTDDDEDDLTEVPPVIEVPDERQPDHFSCGAAAAMSCGKYFEVGPDDIEEWKEALGTTLAESTHPSAIVNYLSSLGLKVTAQHKMTIEDLWAHIANDEPVICPVQDYMNLRESGATFDYGHYLTVVGVVPGYIICQDSSIENAENKPGGDVPANLSKDYAENVEAPGRVIISNEEWNKIWHDEDAEGNPYIQFGIAVGKSN